MISNVYKTYIAAKSGKRKEKNCSAAKQQALTPRGKEHVWYANSASVSVKSHSFCILHLRSVDITIV